MSAPNIAPLPTPPNRGTDTQSQFDTKADTFLTALPNFGAQQNTLGAWMNSTGNTINQRAVQTAADSVTAQSAGEAAVSIANFKGAWQGLTGALAVPATVLHNGNYWALLSATSNVALIEPGVSPQWALVPVAGYNNFIRNIESKATLLADFVRNEFKVWEAPYGQELKQITDVLTTTRASSGTVNTPFGVQTRAANIARIQSDGLLCEETRTNLYARSGDFSHSDWTPRFNTTVVTKTDETSPLAGISTNVYQLDSSDDGAANVIQAVSVTIGKIYTLSRFVKFISGGEIYVIFLPSAAFNEFSGSVTFSMSGGVVVSSQSALSRIEPYGNGWYRIAVTATASDTASVSVQHAVSNYPASAVNSSTGAQAEVGSFPTSYIKTEASQVTRAGENTIHNLPTPPTDQFTIFCNATPIGRSTELSNVVRLFSIADSTDQASNMLSVEIDSTNRLRTRSVVVPNLAWDADVQLDNNPLKIALVLSKSQGFVRLYLNGRLVVQNNSAVISYDITNWQWLRLWFIPSSSSGSTITRALRYFPRALSDAELIALTGGN